MARCDSYRAGAAPSPDPCCACSGPGAHGGVCALCAGWHHSPDPSCPCARGSQLCHQVLCSTFLWSPKSCYPRNSVSVGKSPAISRRFSPRFPSLTPSSCCLLGIGEYEAVMSTTQMTMICSKTRILSIIYFFSVETPTKLKNISVAFFPFLVVGG